MVYLIIAGSLLFLFINFEVISVLLRRNSKGWEINKRYGTAEVVGYDTSERSRWYSLVVKVIELDDGKTYICSSGKIDIHNYPKGSMVNVIYAKRKYFGISMMDICLADSLPANEDKLSKVFKVIGYIFLIAMLIVLLAWIISII